MQSEFLRCFPGLYFPKLSASISLGSSVVSVSPDAASSVCLLLLPHDSVPPCNQPGAGPTAHTIWLRGKVNGKATVHTEGGLEGAKAPLPLRSPENHLFHRYLLITGASLVAQTVKNLLVMQETRILSPGRKDALEKEMATHSSILALRIPWTEEPGGLQSIGFQRVRHDWATSLSLYTEVMIL